MSRPLLALPALFLLTLPAAAGDCGADCYRRAWMPPVYETQAERFVVQAPRTYAHVSPAQYAVVHEKVLTHPGSRRWSVTLDHLGREVGCWITTPARYATVARKVLVRGPEATPIAQGAQYGLRMHTAMTQPAYRAWVPAALGR